MIGDPYVVCGWLVLSLAGSWTTAVKVRSNRVIQTVDLYLIVKRRGRFYTTLSGDSIYTLRNPSLTGGVA